MAKKKKQEKPELKVAEEEVVVEEQAELEEEKKQSEEAAQEKEEPDYKSKYYYLAAEMENMRKRFDREKLNLIKYGNEKILSNLLEVIDNLDHSLDALTGEEDEKIKNIVSGINMVRGQFLGVLNKNGLTEVESMGKIFDPNFHEAMAQQPAEGKEDQEIINVYQKGYVLNGRLLRAAKVIVAKNS